MLLHRICGKDCRHPILQAQSGSLSHWLTYLSHRSCHARRCMEQLSYFVPESLIPLLSLGRLPSGCNDKEP
jgi:hypothetical protein